GGFFDDGMFPTGSPFAVAVAGVIRLASGVARLPADRPGEAKTEPSALAGEGHDPCRTALSFGLPNMSASAAITADWGQARTQCCSLASIDATTLASRKPVMLRGNARPSATNETHPRTRSAAQSLVAGDPDCPDRRPRMHDRQQGPAGQAAEW